MSDEFEKLDNDIQHKIHECFNEISSMIDKSQLEHNEKISLKKSLNNGYFQFKTSSGHWFYNQR